MLFLTKLHLENYCGYVHHTFDFKKPDGNPHQFVCFFGPNGVGKTAILGAISLLTANQMGRDPNNVQRSLRKYVKNTDYDPHYERISGHAYKNDFAISYEDSLPHMIIEGTYELDGKSYVVRLSQDGFERNDLAPTDNGGGPWGDDHLKYRQRVAHTLTADSDLSMSKFQLVCSAIPIFEEITSRIMRYPTSCTPPSGIVPMDQEYCTDFTLFKRGDKIHYKRMSAGEQKITTAFSQLFNLMYDLANPDPGDEPMVNWPRLLLVDNIDLHIYYDRHIEMVECMKKYFNHQQIFATTHSGVLIPRFKAHQNDQINEMYVDLEEVHEG